MLLTIKGLENELTDSRPRVHGQWSRAEVAHFQHLLAVNAWSHEGSTDVHHQTQTGKATATFQPSAQSRAEPEAFLGNSKDGLTGHDQDVLIA